MQLANWSMFIICFCLAGGIINGSGIFNQVDVPETDTSDYESINMSEGVTRMPDSGATSASDISSSMDGWGMLASTFGMLLRLVGVLAIPYFFLADAGVPDSYAVAVQVMINLATIWGLIQWKTNRSTKNLE